MAVIDIRDNPAIDLHVAQSIGNIFSAIGRSEALRKKKYDMDTIMGQVAAGEPISNAIQITRESDVAPYDKGLAGIWQRLGNAASFGQRPDITEDMTEKMLMAGLQRELQMQDPMYQAQLEGAKLGNKGEAQRQGIVTEMAPSQISTAKSQAKVSEVKAAAVPEQTEQELAARAMENKAAELKLAALPDMLKLDKETAEFALKSNKKKLGMSEADFEMSKENHNTARVLNALKIQGQITQDAYDAEMRPLLKQEQELRNKYLESQTGYTERRGTGLTVNQRAAILKLLQEALSMTTDPAVAKTWAGIAKAAGFEIKQDDTGNFVIEDVEGGGGGGGGGGNMDTESEQPGDPNVVDTVTGTPVTQYKAPKTPAEFAAIKSGEQYLDLDGRVYTKK